MNGVTGPSGFMNDVTRPSDFINRVTRPSDGVSSRCHAGWCGVGGQNPSSRGVYFSLLFPQEKKFCT